MNFVPLNHDAKARAKSRQVALTKPRGSLGRLERIPIQLAALQGKECPRSRPASAVIFASDHPVSRHGVSAYPSAVTAAMVRNFVSGGAAASVSARFLGVPLAIVDVGVKQTYDAPAVGDVSWKRVPVADEPVGDLRVEDAMSPAVFDAAIEAGRWAVNGVTPETKILILGEMGIGNTTAAAAVTAGVLAQPPAALVGAGTGVNGDALANKVRVVEDAVARLGPEPNPLEVLRRVGGRELVAIAGAARRAAERGMAVLVDGYVVSAALLALCRHEPQVRSHLIFAHRSREQGHRAILDWFDAEPLLDLDLALGEGSGAFAALPLVDLACTLHAEMATFAEASVPEEHPG